MEHKSSAPPRVAQRKRRVRNKSVSRTWSLSDPMPRAALVVNPDKVYEFIQTAEGLTALSTSVTLETFTVFTTSLSALPQYVTFQALFDQYRIAEVEVWLIPRCAPNAATTRPGLLTTLIDEDDNNLLTTVGSALEYQDAVTTSGSQGHYRRFVPHVADALYSGAFTSFGNRAAPWIDVASPSVIHYGFKAACTTTDIVYVYDILSRLRIQFRNVR